MTTTTQKTPTTKSSKTDKISKSAKTTQRSNKETTKTEIVFSEQRHRMISDSAYCLAEDRGFEPGLEMTDWLEAEKQVDVTLLKQSA